MKFYIVIVFFVFALHLQAQTWKDVTNEYIINPSFELYDTCPNGISALGDYQINYCIGWTTPTFATSDYFNSCNISGIVDVPLNQLGWQFAYDGDGYLGFGLGDNSTWYEYIQSKLVKKLSTNTKYKFSMRISRADEMGSISHQNIGAHFSQNNMQNYTTTAPYNLTPIVLNSTGFITDTLNWVLVSGEFTAQGGEEYLTIGWFGDDYMNDFTVSQNIYIDSITNDTFYIAQSYYYVDSLKLYALENDVENFNINTFSPNGDGVNDFLNFSIYELKELDFTVYNRWGNVVFNSTNTQLKWDGKNNDGKPLSAGTYYYILKATTQENSIVTKHNFLTIFY